MAGYYDVTDILADDEKVPVSLRVALPGVGLALDPGGSENDLAQGTKIELPFWMLPMFLTQRYVTVMNSRKFGVRLRKEVQADAACVNLKSVSPLFYTFGMKLAAVVPDKTLGATLNYTFTERYGEVLVTSLMSSEQELGPKKRLLSWEELEMVEAGQGALARYVHWQQRLHTTIRASSILGRNTSKRVMPPSETEPNTNGHSRRRH